MGKTKGKGVLSALRRRPKKSPSSNQRSPPQEAIGAVDRPKKKAGVARLWMRLDRWGQSELVELEKNAIIRIAGIPARDLRILGPLFSHSSNILGNSFSFSHFLLIELFA